MRRSYDLNGGWSRMDSQRKLKKYRAIAIYCRFQMARGLVPEKDLLSLSSR